MADEAMSARCMKCKENKEMKDTEEVTMKNGRPAAKGVCADCGTKMFKILPGAKKADEVEVDKAA